MTSLLFLSLFVCCLYVSSITDKSWMDFHEMFGISMQETVRFCGNHMEKTLVCILDYVLQWEKPL